MPGTLGPGLSEAGQFPSSLTHSRITEASVDGVKSEIQFHEQTPLCLHHVKITGDEVGDNTRSAVPVLKSLLKKSWQSLPALSTESTRGSPAR